MKKASTAAVTSSTTSSVADWASTSSISEKAKQTATHVNETAHISSIISETTRGSQSSTSTTTSQPVAPTTGSATSTEAGKETDDAFSDASFLSFEDWKRQILEKDKDNLKDGKGNTQGTGEREETLDSLGDDHEIHIDFGALFGGDKDKRKTQQKPKGEAKSDRRDDRDDQKEVAKAGQQEAARYRSKDAGKTCKERTNFASFDSGAQIMKANPEAQSASQILSENKDRYMLNTCGAKNKFLIVELSDSILVDTVALANFEFFSSTFRTFRLSVSAEYPVKLEKWVELGVFEAKNAREIQAFRIEDPRIWARYLRIESLSHYGNEFYCPVSLLRVHGRTMIQDILSQEHPEEEEVAQKEPLKEEVGETMIPEAIADVVEEEEKVEAGLKEAKEALEQLVKTAANITGTHNASFHTDRIYEVETLLENASQKLLTSPWGKTKSMEDLFNESERLSRCYPWEQELENLTTQSRSNTTNPPDNRTADPITRTEEVVLPDATISPTSTRDASQPTIAHNVTQPALQTITPGAVVEVKLDASVDSAEKPLSSSPISSQPSSFPAAQSSSTSVIPAAHNTTSSIQASVNRASTSTSQHAQPTTQESFFKNVSKRLTLLESDSSLSLKYIEEQSRSLRSAFKSAEKRQLTKVTEFLDNLNNTVLPRLEGYREQYENIWQSTVWELEEQKRVLSAETGALSERLRHLADELVFQKRMAIAQSILLLLCLVLVLFGRYLPGGIEIWRHHVAGMRDTRHDEQAMERLHSGVSSPDYRSPDTSPGPRRKWTEKESKRPALGRRMHSDVSQRSQSVVDGGPRTPFSDYSDIEPISPPPEKKEDNSWPFNGSDIIEGVRRRLPGDEEPVARRNTFGRDASSDRGGELSPEESDLSYVKMEMEMEEAMNKESLPAFQGAPHYSPSQLQRQRQSQQQSSSASFTGSPAAAVNTMNVVDSGVGRSASMGRATSDMERLWFDSPEQSVHRLPRHSGNRENLNQGYVSDGARAPRIRVTPESLQQVNGRGSGHAGQGCPETPTPRRFSIARKPLPALPPGEK